MKFHSEMIPSVQNRLLKLFRTCSHVCSNIWSVVAYLNLKRHIKCQTSALLISAQLALIERHRQQQGFSPYEYFFLLLLLSPHTVRVHLLPSTRRYLCIYLGMCVGTCVSDRQQAPAPLISLTKRLGPTTSALPDQISDFFLLR